MPILAAVELHASSGEYLRYVLVPHGDSAEMTYADTQQAILTGADFPDPDRLEWRLQSGLHPSGNIVLTVHDENGVRIGTHLHSGAVGSNRVYGVGLGFVTAVSYDLTIDRMDGFDQLIATLGTDTFTAPPNLQNVGTNVFLRN